MLLTHRFLALRVRDGFGVKRSQREMLGCVSLLFNMQGARGGGSKTGLVAFSAASVPKATRPPKSLLAMAHARGEAHGVARVLLRGVL